MTKGSKRPASPNLAARLIGLPEHLKIVEKQVETLGEENQELKAELARSEEALGKMGANLEAVKGFLLKVDERLSELQHGIAIRSGGSGLGGVNSSSAVGLPKTKSISREFDYFYKMIAEQFGGSDEQNRERLEAYLPLFKGMPEKLQKTPIVDLAPGRGELLKLLKKNGFHAVGVADSRAAVEAMRRKGLSAAESDMRAFLLKQRIKSIAAIVCLRTLERIPFETLLRIVNECYRSLMPGGMVVFEALNPGALFVSSNLFNLDPSRLHLLPPELLGFVLQKAGFATEIIYGARLQPEIGHADPAVDNLFNLVYGPETYTMVGRKGM